MNEYKLEIAKGIITDHLEDGRCGIFNSRNWVGDTMSTIYDNEELGLTVDLCYNYGYFEVFGLSEEEFADLKKYYDFICENTPEDMSWADE